MILNRLLSVIKRRENTTPDDENISDMSYWQQFEHKPHFWQIRKLMAYRRFIKEERAEFDTEADKPDPRTLG